MAAPPPPQAASPTVRATAPPAPTAAPPAPQNSCPLISLLGNLGGSPGATLDACLDESDGEHREDFPSDGTEPPPPTCLPPAPPMIPHPRDRLLHAIALEELAIAALINAEAEKAQTVAKQPLTPLTPDELIAFQHSIAKVLEMAVEKEKLLLKKLRLLLFEVEQGEECE